VKYDCRKGDRDPAARAFPCAVRIVDAVTGERIPNVFYADTAPEGGGPSLGRFLTGPGGEPMVSPVRKKRWADDGRGGKRVEVYYDRLEVWERRPWVAVALDTGTAVAKSEGAP
jgi:hypothetical protein